MAAQCIVSEGMRICLILEKSYNTYSGRVFEIIFERFRCQYMHQVFNRYACLNEQDPSQTGLGFRASDRSAP